MKVAHDFILY